MPFLNFSIAIKFGPVRHTLIPKGGHNIYKYCIYNIFIVGLAAQTDNGPRSAKVHFQPLPQHGPVPRCGSLHGFDLTPT